MNRLATTIMLGGWFGFAAVGAGALALRAFDDTDAASAALADLGATTLALPHFTGMAAVEAAGSAMLLALMAAGLGLALVLLHSRAAYRHAEGERIAAAALVGLAALYAAAAVSGAGVSALFGSGPNFLFVLALGFAALLFDHLVAVEHDPEADAAFEAALASILRSMAEHRGENARHDGQGGAKQ